MSNTSQFADSSRKPKHAPGGQRHNKNAAKSGHYALERSLKRDGFGVLTRRQREVVRAWRQQIEEDAGGRENLSELKRQQLERYLVTEVLLQSLDTWLLQQKSIVNKRRRSVIPALEQRSRLVETSLRLATSISADLKRVERPAESLASILAKHAEREQERRPESESSDELHDDAITQPAASNGQDEGTEEEQQLESTAVPAPHSLTATPRSEGGS